MSACCSRAGAPLTRAPSARPPAPPVRGARPATNERREGHCRGGGPDPVPPPSAPGRVPQDGTGPASCLGRPAVSSKAPECPLVPWPTRQTLSEALGGGDFQLGQTWKLRPSARGAGCAPRWPSELAPRSPSDRRNWRGPVLKPGPTRGAGSSWGLMVMGGGNGRAASCLRARRRPEDA